MRYFWHMRRCGTPVSPDEFSRDLQVARSMSVYAPLTNIETRVLRRAKKGLWSDPDDPDLSDQDYDNKVTNALCVEARENPTLLRAMFKDSSPQGSC